VNKALSQLQWITAIASAIVELNMVKARHLRIVLWREVKIHVVISKCKNVIVGGNPGIIAINAVEP